MQIETVHLQNKHLSLVLAKGQRQLPWIAYLGKSLSVQTDLDQLALATVPAVAQNNLDNVRIPPVFSTEASGLFIQPDLRGHRNGQNWCPVFEFEQWVIKDNSLVVTLTSNESLTVNIEYKLSVSGVLSVRNTLTSTATLAADRYQVDDFSVSILVPSDYTQLQSFTGRWCQEFQPQLQTIPFGATVFENLKGRTSSDHFPGIILGKETIKQQTGAIISAHLAWSGNHQIRVHKAQVGFQLISAGEKLLPGELALATNECLSTPWLHLSVSQQGLNQASQQYHQFVRQDILHWPVVKPRPVHLNTWEAVYFRHDLTELTALADKAASIGVERFILDDGWFGKRDDDTSSLGDWFIDERKYPNGLKPLIDHVKNLGMEFGLWFEPEMINPNSQLFKQHPDWVLATDIKNQPLARNQMVLDLSNPDVFNYLTERLESLLTENTVDYIKWDMNRDLVQASHLGQASVHNQTLKVYELFGFVRQKFPIIEIESCASGGSRMDMEILRHSHRFWTSDCNDALERQTIQRNASIFFPIEVLGAHMGPLNSHTTSRQHAASFRAQTALFGHMGIEAHLNESTEQEIKELSDAIVVYKANRDMLHSGNLYRLDTDASVIAMGVVSQDQHTALFSCAQISMPSAAILPNIILDGLTVDSHYLIEVIGELTAANHRMIKLPPWVEQKNFSLTGEVLMSAGLTLPVLDPDSCLLIKITAK